ncbi:MAG: nitrogen fixation protein NifX [Nitrospiraceae bacterium]|nr:nitrogen fixation protein NifX [Nitrospiraceae bacterium]
MKIAFATVDGTSVDEHFGRAGMFAVYNITRYSFEFLEFRKFAPAGRDLEIESSRDLGQMHEDKVQAKVERLSDCRIVYFTEIGGPAAARLVGKGIMPVKVKNPLPIREALTELLGSINKSMPPWLRKAMNADETL